MDFSNAPSDSMTAEQKTFYFIVYTIRNMKPLTTEMIECIHNMPHNDKMEIIMTYNSMLVWIGTLLEY
jgi:hypothetical protein